MVLPILVVILFVKYRGRFGSQEFLDRYGALTRSYRPEYFFWELVEIARKASVVLCIDFLTLSTPRSTRLLIIYGLMMAYTFLVIFFRPYKNERLNTLNTWWSLVPGAMILCIAFFEQADVSDGEKDGLAAAAIGVLSVLFLATAIMYGREFRRILSRWTTKST